MGWLEWSDTYLLNVPPLDADHRDLVDRVAGIYEMAAAGAPASEVARGVNLLMERFARHADLEDRYLAALTSPGGEEHRRKHAAEHASFLEHLAVLRTSLTRGDDVRQAVEALGVLLTLVEMINTDFEMVGLLRREGRLTADGELEERAS